MRRRYVVEAEYRSEDVPHGVSGGMAGGFSWSRWRSRHWFRWFAQTRACGHLEKGAARVTITDARTGASVPLF